MFHQIRPAGIKLFHADRQTNMKLIVAFRNFANAPKMGEYTAKSLKARQHWDISG
jgi:hypothetical protein